MTRYGRSPWVDGLPKSRVPSHPSQRGALTTQVVVVGGGLIGCTTAYAFAAAGIPVVLLEADRLGLGETAGSLGWVSDTPGSAFHGTVQTVGLKAARHAWQAWRRASLDFAALLRRLDVRCRLEPGEFVQIARTVDQAAGLKREAKARRDGRLEAVFASAAAARTLTGIDAVGALRTRDGATMDPYRAALGLASAAAERGATIFERSPVKKVRFDAKGVEVETAGGRVRAARVVIATGRPKALSKALVRHFRSHSTFFALTDPIATKVRRTFGAPTLVIRDSATPAHTIRWVDGERLLVSGADATLPAKLSDTMREKTIVQRTGQLMYELSTLYPDISGIAPSYGWGALASGTTDGLPFIGPHRNFPRHLFAFGCGGHTVTDAYLASRVLLRHHLDEAEPADLAFGFTTGRL